MTKDCEKCGKEKPLNDFIINDYVIRSNCEECVSANI